RRSKRSCEPPRPGCWRLSKQPLPRRSLPSLRTTPSLGSATAATGYTNYECALNVLCLATVLDRAVGLVHAVGILVCVGTGCLANLAGAGCAGSDTPAVGRNPEIKGARWLLTARLRRGL